MMIMMSKRISTTIIMMIIKLVIQKKEDTDHVNGSTIMEQKRENYQATMTTRNATLIINPAGQSSPEQ